METYRIPLCLVAAALLHTVSGTALAAHLHSPSRVTHPPANVRVTHDSYANHAEPYLAVNPHNPRNLLGAAQYLDRSDLALAGTFVSFDGGRSWRDSGLLPKPAGFNTSLDVTAVFDAAGTGFVAALLSNAARDAFSNRRGLAVWRTTNGGRSFSRPILVLRGQFADHPWLAIDPPTIRRGRALHQTLYLAWANDHGLSLSRSTDGGRTFSHPSTIPGTGQLVGDPVLTAGPPGEISVVYYSSTTDRKLSVHVISSGNGGRTFGQPHTVPLPPGETLLYGKGVPSSRVSAAVDPPRHALYVSFAAYQGSPGRADVLVARSLDNGRTWDAPVRADRPATTPTMNQQPQVAVTPAGTVAVSYFALTGGRMSVYLSRSTTSGTTFPAPQRLSNVSFDPALGIRTIERGRWWIGDYQGLAAGPGTIYACWNDTRSGRLEIYVAAVPAR